MLLGTISLSVNWAEREADHSSSTSDEITSARSVTSVPFRVNPGLMTLTRLRKKKPYDLYAECVKYRVITNEVSDSDQCIYVLAHIICNHPVYSTLMTD
jgi:hypothetical protein